MKLHPHSAAWHCLKKNNSNIRCQESNITIGLAVGIVPHVEVAHADNRHHIESDAAHLRTEQSPDPVQAVILMRY